MNTNNWPRCTTGMPEISITTRPVAARRYRSLLLPLLTIFLSASIVEAQAPSPRASAAASIAAKRLQVPETELLVVNEAQAEGINSIKVFHPRTGRIEDVNLDSENRPVPGERVEQVLAARRQAGFRGKQEKALADRVAGRPATEPTTVVVWVRLPGPPPRLERPGASGAGPAVSAEAYREFHRNATHGLVEQARAQGWTVVYQSQEAPVVVLEVPAGQLKALEARGDVDAIYLSRQYGPELAFSAAAIGVKGTDKVWSRGLTGTNVKVAVIEYGSIYFGHDNLPNGTYCNPPEVVAVNSHVTGVAGIIASTHSTHQGIAHGVPPLLNGNLANGSDSELMKCTDWALSQGAKVLNFSFGDVTNTTESTDSPYFAGSDRYVDYVVRNRGVTIVKSAGNSPSTNNPGTCFSPSFWVTSPGKGYNVLTVGAYNDRNTVENTDDIMHITSCWGNPYSMFSQREKPELVAPGYEVFTTTTGSPISPTATVAEYGTSFAAPHVTGCAALLMQYNTSLQSWPEAIRAILMASAVTNIDGPTLFYADLTLEEKDGVGGLECDAAYDIVSRAAGGEEHAPVTSVNFPKDFTFNATAGKTVRAAIAWDSTPSAPGTGTTPTSDPLLADLELAVYAPNGAVVATSYNRDNSFEIVEFTAPATGTYIARVFANSFQGSSEYLAFAWWQGVRVDN